MSVITTYRKAVSTNRGKMMKIKSLEELMVDVKEEERKRKAVLAKRGRDQFKKKGRR